MLAEDVVTVDDAARMLGCSSRTIRRLVEVGQAHAYGRLPLLVSISEVGEALHPHARNAEDEIDLAAKLSPAARIAFARLNRALAQAVQAGQPPPCAAGGGDRWLSDNPADRAEAARLCVGCTVLGLCGEYADAAREAFGVWAARDRGAVTTRRKEGAA